MPISVATAEVLAGYLDVPDWLIATAAAHTYRYLGPIADAFTQTVQTAIPQVRLVEDFMKKHEHPFSSRLPLMNFNYVLFSVVCYLFLCISAFLVGRIVGKSTCRWYGILHNFLLCALSLYMCVSFAVCARAADYSLWNNGSGVTKAEWRLAKIGWIFYVSKIPEWIDTVLMLLKHNYRQVSFLHVYHHVSVFVIYWIGGRIGSDGEMYYCAMVNSGIHVVMYGYYFLTLLFPSGPVRSVLNRFKFIITQGQMIQFAFNCLQTIYDLVYIPRSELKFNATLLHLLFWYMISLLVLFGNFYVRNSFAAKSGKGKKKN